MARPLTTTGVGTEAQSTANVTPAGGTLFLVGDGGADVTYVPTPAGEYYVDPFGGNLVFYPYGGFSGTAPSVTYKITDNDFQSSTSTYTATVIKPPPPTAAPLSSTGQSPNSQNADTSSIPGYLDASLVSGGTQVHSLVVAGKGTYYAYGGDGISVSFTPVNCFVGTVSTVTYRLADQYDQHADSTYTAHVTKPNPPTASALTSGGSGMATQTATAPQPACVGSTKLLNAGGQPVSTLTRADGTYTVNPATGVITFAPAPGDFGTGPAVYYRVTDQFGQHADGTYTTNVEPPPPPTALPLTSTGDGPAAQHVTAVVPASGHATLLDGVNPVTSLTIAGQGTYTVNPTSGVITFTPEADYFGTADPVSYQVTDSYNHSSNVATYTPTVTEPAAPNPTALSSTGPGPVVQSRTVTIPPAGTVTLLDGQTPVSTITVAGQGKYVLDPATGVIRFTPVTGFVGTATPAAYQVTDSYGQTGSSTYTPTVTLPAPPAASPLSSHGIEGNTQRQTVTIPTGGAVTLLNGGTPAATVTNAGQGTYTLDTVTGVITFAPLAGYSGHPTPVTYQVSDAYGQSGRSTYSPTVNAAAATTTPTTTTPTTTTATPTVSPTATSTPTSNPTATATPAAGGALPNTGSNVGELTQIALLLLVVGIALTASGRRRRRPAQPSRHR